MLITCFGLFRYPVWLHLLGICQAFLCESVGLYFYYRFPTQCRRVTVSAQRRIAGRALQDNVEPIILFQALRGFVFVLRPCDIGIERLPGKALNKNKFLCPN